MHDMNQLMRKIQKETRTAGIAVSKLSQKNNPAPNTFFDDHIPNLETEMDKMASFQIEQGIMKLYLQKNGLWGFHF